LRALCSSRSLGAPCGTFVCRESELKTFSGDQIPLLDSRCLVFLPAAHLAGITLKGFGPEPVPWAVLVGVPWAVLVGAPRPRLGRSLGSPCRRTSSAPRAFPGQSLAAHLFRVSGVPWAVLVGALWALHVGSPWALLGPFVCWESELKTSSGDKYVSLAPTALSFGWSLTRWAWL
jgi:hypothetical protein